MVQMRTVLRVADNSGAKLIRVINILRRKKQRPSGNVGSVCVASVIATDRAVKVKKVAKGDVVRALVVRSKNEKVRHRAGGGSVRMDHTAAVLLGTDLSTPLGTRIRGPVSASLDRSRFLKVFSLARVSLFSSLASGAGVRSRR